MRAKRTLRGRGTVDGVRHCRAGAAGHSELAAYAQPTPREAQRKRRKPKQYPQLPDRILDRGFR